MIVLMKRLCIKMEILANYCRGNKYAEYLCGVHKAFIFPRLIGTYGSKLFFLLDCAACRFSGVSCSFGAVPR